MFEVRDFLMLESQHSKTLHNSVRYWGQSRPSGRQFSTMDLLIRPRISFQGGSPLFNIFNVPQGMAGSRGAQNFV